MTTFKQRRSFAALIAVSALILTSITTAQAAPERVITWENCPESANQPGVQCGRIDVPMNYSDPHGKQISVGLVKLPAKGTSRGLLFINPGGPGGSVYDLFDTNSPMPVQWPEDVRNEWDIIAVQPRGLEGSTPLECTVPTNMSSSSLTNFGGKIKQECDKVNPGYAETINTENTASDWEEVRKALREDKISLLGVSYGTYLTSMYATKFPQHTDKVVLDSGYNMDADGSEQIRGFDEASTDFFTWVAKHDGVYHMGTTPRAVYEKWAVRVQEESGVTPTIAPPNASDDERLVTDIQGLLSQIASGGGNQKNSPTLLLTSAIVGAPQFWPKAAKMISGTDSVELPGAGEDMKEISAMGDMVMCNDRKAPIQPAHLIASMWGQLTGSPYTTLHMLASGVTCDGIEPVQPAREISGAALETKPLQIQGTRDMATPYWNFSKMSDAMQSHVLTVDGPGHGQSMNYLPELNKIIGEYLRTGKVEATRVAGIDPQPE